MAIDNMAPEKHLKSIWNMEIGSFEVWWSVFHDEREILQMMPNG